MDMGAHCNLIYIDMHMQLILRNCYYYSGIAMADTYGMARGAVGCDVRVINNLDQSTTA